MFRKRKEKKAIAKKQKELEQNDAYLVRRGPLRDDQALAIDPPRSDYFRPRGRDRERARYYSMEVLNERESARPPPPPVVARPNKKRNAPLRSVKSFSVATDERNHGRNPQLSRYAYAPTSQEMHAPGTSFYTANGSGTSGQVSVHPNLKSSAPSNSSRRAQVLGYTTAHPPSAARHNSPGAAPHGYPVTRTSPPHLVPAQRQLRHYNAAGQRPPPNSPTTYSLPNVRTPSPLGGDMGTLTRDGRAARYRNIQIIPQSLGSPNRRPLSVEVTTPIHAASNVRTPSPLTSSHAHPHRSKGTPIKIIEGWNEPVDAKSNVVQSHEVGVAPRSKVIEAYRNRNHASPFAITISNQDQGEVVSAGTVPGHIKFREGSDKRRNKARPVSAVPYTMITEEEELRIPKKSTVQTKNGEISITFDT